MFAGALRDCLEYMYVLEVWVFNEGKIIWINLFL